MGEAPDVLHLRESIRGLQYTIHSVVGLKTTLTTAWADSVRHIVKYLASAETSRAVTPATRINESLRLDENANAHPSVEKITAELAVFTERIRRSNFERRQALNELLDLKGNIRVFCRVRPFLPYEHRNNPDPVLVSDSYNLLLNITGGKRKQYTFDRVFHPNSTQEEVFSEIEPMIKSALDGYNICIFAYGQTGTGKTYSMEGRLDSPGIVPRAMKMLFEHHLQGYRNLQITFSMLEIYMGNLRDLLVPRRDKLVIPSTPCLSIQTDPGGGIDIENLVAIKVNNFLQVKDLYKTGIRSRSTASTLANATSSRSHCLVRISISCPDESERKRKTNKIWLVDLGGSERLLKTQAKGRQLEEGKAINLSLSAIADVISALQRRKPHVPYRNSKLTQVLKDSLGENSKVLMLAHVSPKEEDLCESVCSLRFATRVRSTPLGNEIPTEAREIKEARISQLSLKLQYHESECEGLTRKIQKLTDLINHLNGSVCKQQLSVLHVPTEDEHSDKKVAKQITKDLACTLEGVPRFMRPTFCSQRKLVLDHQSRENSRKTLCAKTKRRKTTALYAESVIQTTKGGPQFGCGTELNESQTGLLDRKCDRDTEPDTLDCEIKKMIHEEQKISHISSVVPVQIKNVSVNNSCLSQKNYEDMYHTVDKWIQAYSQGNKRVIAVSIPERCKQHTEENYSFSDNEADISVSGAEQVGLGSELYFDRSWKDIHRDDSVNQTTELLAEHSSVMKSVENTDISMDQVTEMQPKSPRETFLIQETLLGSTNQTLLTYEEWSRNLVHRITNKEDNNNFGGQEACGVKIHRMRNLLKYERMLWFPDELLENNENAGLNDCKVPSINQELRQTKGAWKLLGQTFQIFVTGILLGLGLKSLGFGQKFYQALTS